MIYLDEYINDIEEKDIFLSWEKKMILLFLMKSIYLIGRDTTNKRKNHRDIYGFVRNHRWKDTLAFILMIEKPEGPIEHQFAVEQSGKYDNITYENCLAWQLIDNSIRKI